MSTALSRLLVAVAVVAVSAIGLAAPASASGNSLTVSAANYLPRKNS